MSNSNHCTCNHQKRLFLQQSLATSTLLLPFPAIAKFIRQGVTSFSGQVYINGLRVKGLGMPVHSNDYIAVSANSHLSFVIGQDAYFLEANTTLQLQSKKRSNGFFSTGLKLFRGAFLAAFGEGRKKVYTPHVTIGIRGTGIYLKALPQQTYFCTCYGETEIILPQQAPKIIRSTHHQAQIIQNHQITPSVMQMHHDQQNMALESLVQRQNPFL